MIQFLLFFSVLSCKLVCIDNNYPIVNVFYAHDPKLESFWDNFSVSIKSSSYPDSFRSPLVDQAITPAILQSLIQQPQFCAKRYNLSVKEVSELLKADTADIVEKLLKLDHLTDLVIMELWNVCKHAPRDNKKQRKQYQKQVGNIEKELKKSLLLRAEKRKLEHEKQKAYKLKELQRLEKVYNSINLSSSNDYVSTYQSSREIALSKTKQNAYVNHVQSHHIDVQTTGMLIAQGINHKQFENLSGTVFQHQLFKEIAQGYKKIAKVCFEAGLKESICSSAIFDFGQAAFLAIGLEDFGLALHLNDLAELLAETSLSIWKGAIGSACNFVDMYVLNPKHTAKQLLNMLVPVIRSMGGAVVQYDLDHIAPVYNRGSSVQVLQNDLHNFNQICVASKKEFEQWYQKSSSQEKIQAISQFMVDGILHPKLFAATGKGCLGIIAKAKELRSLEHVARFLEELGAANFIESVAQSVSKEEQLATTVGEIMVTELEDSLVSLMEAESNVIVKASAGKITAPSMTLEEVVGQLAQKGVPYNNPQFQKEVLLHFNEQFCKELLVESCKKIKEKLVGIKVMLKGKEVDFFCNPEHIFTYDLRFKLNKTIALVEGRIYGGHHGTIIKNLESQKIIQIIEEYPLPCGGRGLRYKHPFGQTIEIKAEFSCKWQDIEVMNNILEAYANPVYSREWFNEFNQKIHIVGRSQNGAYIEMYLKHGQHNDLILETAYPYCKQLSRVPELWKN